jgi:predicted RNA binding protein YcfA (HicA-like mRNA interferase family)
MTKKYPILSGKQIMNCLLTLGFTFVSQKGSHIKICKIEEEIKRTVIIPMHEELAI